jgi:cell division protease FtsH
VLKGVPPKRDEPEAKPPAGPVASVPLSPGATSVTA